MFIRESKRARSMQSQGALEEGWNLTLRMHAGWWGHAVVWWWALPPHQCAFTTKIQAKFLPGQKPSTQAQLITPSGWIRYQLGITLPSFLFSPHIFLFPLVEINWIEVFMLSPIIIRASHSFIKQMFIRSLLHSKASSYVKVSRSELRAMYILTILSSGKNTMCAQEVPAADLPSVAMLWPWEKWQPFLRW